MCHCPSVVSLPVTEVPQSTGSHDAGRNSRPEEELIMRSKCKSLNVSYIFLVILWRPFCIKLRYKILEKTRMLWIDVSRVRGIIRVLTELASWLCALLEKFARCAAIQKYPYILRNPKFQNRVHKNPLLAPMLTQTSPANNTPPHLSSIHFDITNPHIFWSSKSKLFLDRRLVGQIILVSDTHLRPLTRQTYVRHMWLSSSGRPSQKRSESVVYNRKWASPPV
jgi:hypothetical protein